MSKKPQSKTPWRIAPTMDAPAVVSIWDAHGECGRCALPVD